MNDLKIEIELLSGDDSDKMLQLLSVFEMTFNMENFKPPSHTYIKQLLLKDNFLAVVAIIEGRVIGGLTIYTLEQYYSEKPLAYIFDLAVLPEFQRGRIGTRLIRFTIDFLAQKGFEEVFVQADKIDDYALKFYRSTGPTDEEDVIHFYYRLVSN